MLIILLAIITSGIPQQLDPVGLLLLTKPQVLFAQKVGSYQLLTTLTLVLLETW